MGLDDCGLLIGKSFLLGFAQFLDEAQRTTLETALEATAGTGVDELEIRRYPVKIRKSKETYFDELSKLSTSAYFSSDTAHTSSLPISRSLSSSIPR